MFLAPLVPSLAVSIFFHERAEERVIRQPRFFGCAESIKACRMARVFPGSPGKIRERSFQEIDFQTANAIVLDRAFAQLLQIVVRDNVVEVFLRKILGRSGREMQGRRLERDRANRIVRAVIAAHFIDRQELDDLEPNPRRPIDKLPQRLQIADAQIGLRAQREKRREHSRDFLLGRQVHGKMTNDE